MKENVLPKVCNKSILKISICILVWVTVGEQHPSCSEQILHLAFTVHSWLTLRSRLHSFRILRALTPFTVHNRLPSSNQRSLTLHLSFTHRSCGKEKRFRDCHGSRLISQRCVEIRFYILYMIWRHWNFDDSICILFEVFKGINYNDNIFLLLKPLQ